MHEARFRFHPAELRTLRALKTPAGIQRFLDQLPYNLAYTARSPRKVLRDRTGVLFRRRDLRRGGVARARISAAHFRSGSGTGHRSCRRDLQSARTLGRGCDVEFHRLPISRTGLSHVARAGPELLQYLFQSALRTNTAALLTAGESRALRSSRLDDNGQTDLVYRGTSLRNSAHTAAQAVHGKKSHAR